MAGRGFRRQSRIILPRGAIEEFAQRKVARLCYVAADPQGGTLVALFSSE